MVNDFVVASEGGVFVFEGVEAVGTGGDYLFDFIHVEDLDVLERHHLIDKFVSGSAGGVAGAGFFFAEDGE